MQQHNFQACLWLLFVLAPKYTARAVTQQKQGLAHTQGNSNFYKFALDYFLSWCKIERHGRGEESHNSDKFADIINRWFRREALNNDNLLTYWGEEMNANLISKSLKSNISRCCYAAVCTHTGGDPLISAWPKGGAQIGWRACASLDSIVFTPL